MLKDPIISILGPDPNRTHRINSNSFQQNTITTINGIQYAAYYTDQIEGQKTKTCYMNLARRQLYPSKKVNKGNWERLILKDYEQKVDDGHNTISLGIARGDGTVHVAFDHHCDELRFRVSKHGVTSKTNEHDWCPGIFNEIQNFLPGLEPNELMKEVTYPRFLNVEDDLIFTYRIGQAGLGSDILYRYSSITHKYTYLGKYLTGINNSPYINGIDYRLGLIHVSWCYRNFIPFPTWAATNAHKQQAGPNGPENNYDLNYASSDDLGHTWKGSDGQVIARIGDKQEKNVESSIRPGAAGSRVFEIPIGSGILNQEGQAADWEGGFWVLNREIVEGSEKWIVYCRNSQAVWKREIINSVSEPSDRGSRGSICVDKRSFVYLVLPGNTDSSLEIMRLHTGGGNGNAETIWLGVGYDGEPLIDVQRLEEEDILSVYTRTDKGEEGNRDVVVLDFELHDKRGNEM